MSDGVSPPKSLFSNTRRMTLRSVSLTVALLGTGVAWAFPPAPCYTLYGVVRDHRLCQRRGGRFFGAASQD
jgi:hypothetical protein